MYYLGSANQATDHEQTIEFLIKKINMKNDTATALEQLESINLDPHKPTLYLSTDEDFDLIVSEDKQIKI